MSETTTRFKIRTKIGQCAAKEGTRYALNALHVMPSASPGNIRLEATDGRMLFTMRAEGHTDHETLCPAKILPIKASGGTVQKNGTWQNDAGKFIDCQPDGRFPRTADCVPAIDHHYIQLRINAKYLAGLATAVQSDGEHITLFFKPSCRNDVLSVESAIGVIGDVPDAIGVIMPVCTDDNMIPEFNLRRQQLIEDYGSVA